MKLGRDLLDRELRKRGLSFNRFAKGDEVSKVLEQFGLNSTDELYARIGYGRLSSKQVVEVIAPKEDNKAADNLKPGLIERTVEKVRRRNDNYGIRIEGMDDILVRFARCCNPVAGDPVTGWITRGRGVTVHRRGCPRSLELDPQRRVEVSWARDSHVDLPVQLRVVTADRPGILAKVSSVFTENSVNISEANCRTSADGKAVNVFHFTVGDVHRLRTIMRSLGKLDGVENVERV
jgi:GTP pyrophosphokinase